MKYYVNKKYPKNFINSHAFMECGNEKREELIKAYRELTLKEMIDIADTTQSWNDLPPEWYEAIADEIGANINDERYSDLQELIDDAKKFI